MANSGFAYSSVKSPQHPKLRAISQGNPGRLNNTCFSGRNYKFASKSFWRLRGKVLNFVPSSHRSSSPCQSTKTTDTETREHRAQLEDKHPVKSDTTITSLRGLAEACKFVYNDARYVNERAKNDFVLLSRGIMRLDARARRDVAIIGSKFLKLDVFSLMLARAREDTEKIDHNVKKRAERLHDVATILTGIAESRLKIAADKHWSDGALEADLRRADFAAKQRAMEDAFMALEFVKNIHDRMVNKMYNFPSKSKSGYLLKNGMEDRITLEKNGIPLDFLAREVSPDQVDAIEEAYTSIASALSEADGIDYTDPEELELLIATLIDLEAMDGKTSVSLLAECSISPDVNTRKALANALSTAPSLWTLGNAGMGALQRLAQDSNPAIAAAASRTITELKKQWKIEEGDNWRFMVNQVQNEEQSDNEDDKD